MREPYQQHQFSESVLVFVFYLYKKSQAGNYVKQIITFGIDDDVLYIYNLALPCAVISTQTIAMFNRK